MNHETGTGRRQFLKQASLLVAGTQAGALLPSASAAAREARTTGRGDIGGQILRLSQCVANPRDFQLSRRDLTC
jgi:hypothetical protein